MSRRDNRSLLRRHDWIKTFTGRKFYPLKPNPDDICIEDIAHSLARLCRFGGHIHSEFYSVAQHSVLVSAICKPEHALWGLLHDAAEGYGFGDIPRPIKHRRFMLGYRLAEERLQHVIYEKFGLKGKRPADVGEADSRALVIEANCLLAAGTSDWSESDELSWDIAFAGDESGAIARYLLPRDAEEWFLKRFNQIIDRSK